ncbi:MAG: PAS domain S-box protein, partial [Anaerolineales bacterium]
MKRSASRAALLYAVITGLWILAFDVLSDILAVDRQRFAQLHVVLAVLTVLLLYWLLKWELRARAGVEEELRQTQAHLELRVQERTEELTEANRELQAEIAMRTQTEAERERLLAQVQEERERAEGLAGVLAWKRDMLQAIMENTQAQLVYLDPDFNFVRVNTAYVEGSGHSRDELLGRNHFDLFPNQENQAIFERVRDTGQPVTFYAKPFQYVDQPERGTTYWDWSLVPVKDEDGRVQGLVFSLLDVTQRVRAEEELRSALEASRRRRAEVSALLEGARAVLAHRSFEQAARAIFDACKNLLGARAGYVALLTDDGTENEVVFLEPGGLPCSVDPKLPMPIRGLRETAYREGIPVYDNDFAHGQWAKLLPDGHVGLDSVLFAPLVVKGIAVGLLGLANKPGGFDEHDAHLASAFGELASIALFNSRTLKWLETSEERFRSVAVSASAAIITTDSQGAIVFWNRAAESIFGYTADEAMGKPLTFLMPERSQAIHRQELGRMVSTRRPAAPRKAVEMVGLRKRGDEFAMDASYSTWETQEGTFFTHIIRDITERKKAAQALQERTREMAAMQERQRLARDLHDAVSQTLFSASLSAEVLPRLWERDRADAQRCLQDVHQLTRSALAEMRTLLLELRPGALAETPLGDLLNQLAEAVA